MYLNSKVFVRISVGLFIRVRKSSSRCLLSIYTGLIHLKDYAPAPPCAATFRRCILSPQCSLALVRTRASVRVIALAETPRAAVAQDVNWRVRHNAQDAKAQSGGMKRTIKLAGGDAGQVWIVMGH